MMLIEGFKMGTGRASVYSLYPFQLEVNLDCF